MNPFPFLLEDSEIKGDPNPDLKFDENSMAGDVFHELIRVLREVTVGDHDKAMHTHLAELFLKTAEGTARDFEGDHLAWLLGRSAYHLEMANSLSVN